MFQMYIIALFFLSSFFEARVEARVKSRISDGQKASSGEFPYQVYLEAPVDEFHIQTCGGTILDEYHVLTAAHCLDGQSPENYAVIVGTVDLLNIPSALNYSVESGIQHEDYKSGNGWKNDIAILRVNTPFEFNDNVAPAKLPESHEDLKAGQSAIVTGFGAINERGQASPILQKTKVFVEDREVCQKSFKNNKIRSTNLCTVHPSKDTGFCQGDSGGPLTANGKVVGIISFLYGSTCASSGTDPHIYTRISEYIDWIHEHTK